MIILDRLVIFIEHHEFIREQTLALGVLLLRVEDIFDLVLVALDALDVLVALLVSICNLKV